MTDEPTDGDNPPAGAPINFWLGADMKEKDSLLISIKDASNATVRKLYHKEGKAGINRIWWNLREDPSTPILIRNKPLYSDWINLGDKRAIPAPGAPTGFAPLVKPGTYTVVLKAGDKEYTQSLKVLKDPNSEGTEADIAGQSTMVGEIKKDLTTAGDMVNQLESIRRQASDLKTLVKEDKNSEVTKAIDALETQLMDIEGNLIQLRVTPQGQSALRYPAQVVEKLQYLGSAVETADFQPADQHREVHQMLQKRLQDVQRRYNQFLEKDLPAFQEVMKKNNLNGPIIIKATLKNP
jgi:hypothetical protein